MSRWIGPLSLNGEKPQARCSHTCTACGDELYIIGGGWVPEDQRSEQTFVHVAAVQKLTLRTMTWSRVLPAQADEPRERSALARVDADREPVERRNAAAHASLNELAKPAVGALLLVAVEPAFVVRRAVVVPLLFAVLVRRHVSHNG